MATSEVELTQILQRARAAEKQLQALLSTASRELTPDRLRNLENRLNAAITEAQAAAVAVRRVAIGLVTPGDLSGSIVEAIGTEVTNRNSAISTAIGTEVTNRNAAIAAAHIKMGWVLSNLAGQAFTTTESTVTWPTEVRDDGGCFSAGSPTLVTIPSGGAGMYLLTAQGGFTTPGGTNYDIKIKQGGTAIARGAVRGGGVTAMPSFMPAVTSQWLADGDVLIVTLDLDSASESSTTVAPGLRFTGARIYY
jgi:hypothetical protein